MKYEELVSCFKSAMSAVLTCDGLPSANKRHPARSMGMSPELYMLIATALLDPPLRTARTIERQP